MASRSTRAMGSLILCTVYVYIWSQVTLLVTSHDMRVCTINMKTHPSGLCGSHIDEALKVFCGIGGFVGKHGKRSIGLDQTILDMNAKDALDLYKQNALHLERSVMLKRNEATRFLDKRVPHFMSGVSCECCYHLCSVSEMRSYCRNPLKNLNRHNRP